MVRDGVFAPFLMITFLQYRGCPGDHGRRHLHHGPLGSPPSMTEAELDPPAIWVDYCSVFPIQEIPFVPLQQARMQRQETPSLECWSEMLVWNADLSSLTPQTFDAG